MFREVTVDRPNVTTLLSSALIRGDQIVATRGPFIFSLISCPFFWRGVNRRQERGHLISEHMKGPLVATIRSPLVKALDRSVGTLGLWNVTSWLHFLNLQTKASSSKHQTMSYSCPVAMNERIKSLRNISLQAEKSNVLTLRPTILFKFPWLGMAQLQKSKS